MDVFDIDQGVQYYQGMIHKGEKTVIWTDRFKTTHRTSKLQALLYNPVAVVYS